MVMKKFFLSVICLSCFLSAHAEQRVDSVCIYYRTGYRYVEPTYRDNGTQLARFTESIRKALRDGTIERIVVRSGASPDGTNRANELLSVRRADSLVSYIVRRPRSVDRKTSRRYFVGRTAGTGGRIRHAVPRRSAQRTVQHACLDFRRKEPGRGRP